MDVEKFAPGPTATDVERSFTKDQLLDNLMVYWVTVPRTRRAASTTR